MIKGKARGGVLAHQVGDRVLRFQPVAVGDRDLEQAALVGVERGLLERGRHHLAEPFKALDLRLAALADLLQDLRPVGLIQRPIRFFAHVDAEERRLRDVDIALVDERAHVAVKERQQERGDVVPVRVGVHQQDDLVVAQLRHVEVLAEPAAERVDDVR